MSDELIVDPFFVPDKDPAYEYFWGNRADRNMIELLSQGWEVVSGAPELPAGVRQKIAGLTGQSSEVPVTDEVRTRGDLVLVRMPKDLFEERVAAPTRMRIARQRASLDTLVDRANDQARAALAQSRQRSIRERHVFSTTDDSKFETEKVSS